MKRKAFGVGHCAWLLSGLLVWGVATISSSSAEEAAATSGNSQPAGEDERSWGISTAVGVYSEYMFRGKNVYEGTSIQPSITPYVSFGDFGTFSVNTWLQAPAESQEPPERFNELDTTVSYDLPIDIVTLSVGHIFYTFPGGDGRIADTREYFLGFSLDLPLNPSFTFFNDYNKGKYQYYSLTFRETFNIDALGDDASLTPFVNFAFASNSNDGPVFYFDNGLEHIDAGVSTDLKWGSVIVTPHLNYTFKVDDGTVNEFWMGLDFGYDI